MRFIKQPALFPLALFLGMGSLVFTALRWGRGALDDKTSLMVLLFVLLFGAAACLLTERRSGKLLLRQRISSPQQTAAAAVAAALAGLLPFSNAFFSGQSVPPFSLAFFFSIAVFLLVFLIIGERSRHCRYLSLLAQQAALAKYNQTTHQVPVFLCCTHPLFASELASLAKKQRFLEQQPLTDLDSALLGLLRSHLATLQEALSVFASLSLDDQPKAAEAVADLLENTHRAFDDAISFFNDPQKACS